MTRHAPTNLPRQSGLMVHLRRLSRDEDGVALVEFALVLPMMLIVFAVIIEGSRMMLSFQSAVSGVRDATRYLARVVPSDYCSAGGSVVGYTAQMRTIVAQSVSGQSVFPSSVTVNSVTPTVSCISGTYRISPAPVTQVTANVTINLPFAAVFALIGATQAAVTTNVTSKARVFGS